MIHGFSKLSKAGRTEIITCNVPLDKQQVELLHTFQHSNKKIQKVIDEISESAISNYPLPFSIAPNFLINEKYYFVPMVTEESSVVAASAYAAKFWAANGGFRTKVTGTGKMGQIYFTWPGQMDKINYCLKEIKEKLVFTAMPVISRMISRGGGVTNISLDLNKGKSGYHAIDVTFETVDSMGANFINSTLELMGKELITFLKYKYPGTAPQPELVMTILSNYNPDCLVESYVECDIQNLSKVSAQMTPIEFCRKFETAIQIADDNIPRAVTHNKGIYNGIDSVLLATGNDFRAVEACGHAYAARSGRYSSLTSLEIKNNTFRYGLIIPISLGTLGGAVSTHPLTKLALEIMKKPTAKELMQIVASVGLAGNFAAIRSLITEGIQKGHMKLHLKNILYQLDCSETEIKVAESFFKDKKIIFHEVFDYIMKIRLEKGTVSEPEESKNLK